MHLNSRSTYRLLLSLFCIALTGFTTTGQVITDYDTLKTKPPPAEISKAPSPKRATLYSAILPGLGQAYNKKYWKVPIVYGGLGLSLYYILENTKQFNAFRNEYIARVDNDPATMSKEQYDIYTNATLLDIQEYYRRLRDISYISFGLVYIINIVDANVDAHLFRFDVDQDLSLSFRPNLLYTTQTIPGLSIALKL